MLLLGGELVELVAHAVELEARDFLVEIFGHDVDLRLQLLVILQQVFGGESLIGEAHIHDGGRMSFGGSQIDEAAFAEEIDFAAVLQQVFVHKRAHFALAGRQLFRAPECRSRR